MRASRSISIGGSGGRDGGATRSKSTAGSGAGSDAMPAMPKSADDSTIGRGDGRQVHRHFRFGVFTSSSAGRSTSTGASGGFGVFAGRSTSTAGSGTCTASSDGRSTSTAGSCGISGETVARLNSAGGAAAWVGCCGPGEARSAREPAGAAKILQELDLRLGERHPLSGGGGGGSTSASRSATVRCRSGSFRASASAARYCASASAQRAAAMMDFGEPADRGEIFRRAAAARARARSARRRARSSSTSARPSVTRAER